MSPSPTPPDKTVFFLQGGGALGAYQMGVCKKLLMNHYEPDWVIGTSIGSINAAIIAGNPPEKRIAQLEAFWDSIATPTALFDWMDNDGYWRKAQNMWSANMALTMGQPNFFAPRLVNPWFVEHSTPDLISFYDTQPLKQNLERLIDFDLINEKKVRLTLCAVKISDGTLAFLDNTREIITPEHIMASGALPPGFPAIKLHDQYYWDGGLSYVTPLSILFESNISGNVLCFMVDLFANREKEPHNMFDINIRKKDMQFSNHYRHMLHYFCEIHHFRQALLELCESDPSLKSHPIFDKIQSNSLFNLNIVRFHYRNSPNDLFSKDFEFSPKSLVERCNAGMADVENALQTHGWQKPPPPSMGVVLHDF